MLALASAEIHQLCVHAWQCQRLLAVCLHAGSQSTESDTVLVRSEANQGSLVRDEACEILQR